MFQFFSALAKERHTVFMSVRLFVHTTRARESSSHGNKRTESELDVARLESRARAVDGEFASEGGEVLDKVVQHVLHHLLRIGFEVELWVDCARELLEPGRG